MTIAAPKRVVDLFSGAGGAAMGLHHAWPDAEIVGVDVRPQPRYPFAHVVADALTYPLEGADFVWASPPCQGYSRTQHIPNRQVSSAEYPQLVTATRERLVAWGGPWVIENTQGAPLFDAITLCGLMFDLRVFRHRLFESNRLLLQPSHLPHRGHAVAGRSNGKLATYSGADHDGMVTVAGHLFSKAAAQAAMGIDWMTCAEMAESVPPAYAEYCARVVSGVWP